MSPEWAIVFPEYAVSFRSIRGDPVRLRGWIGSCAIIDDPWEPGVVSPDGSDRNVDRSISRGER